MKINYYTIIYLKALKQNSMWHTRKMIRTNFYIINIIYLLTAFFYKFVCKVYRQYIKCFVILTLDLSKHKHGSLVTFLLP